MYDLQTQRLQLLYYCLKQMVAILGKINLVSLKHIQRLAFLQVMFIPNKMINANKMI